MVLPIYGVDINPVVTLSCYSFGEIAMPSFTVTYKDNDTDPDLIEQIAKQHGISPEMLIKRFIGDGIDKHCPADFDIAECENISDFMNKGGYRK